VLGPGNSDLVRHAIGQYHHTKVAKIRKFLPSRLFK
jgi:hypothetical protein